MARIALLFCAAIIFLEILNATLTPMNIVVSLLEMDAYLSTMAQGAARLAFPHAAFSTFATLEEALKSEAAAGGELLILANPDKISLARALRAPDASGLRRWAIVVLGATPAVPGVEIVSPEEWSELLLVRAFRSAAAQHQIIRQNERMRGDLRTWSSRISHDLRTPLGGILTAGEALKEMLEEHDPSSAGLAKPLFSSVEELERLIQRVSMLTKACAHPVPKKLMAMEEPVWAVLQRQERQILKKNAVVTQPGAWPEVTAVSAWLEVVWGDLLGNALQHGDALPRIELGWSRSDRDFRFWVSDNGGGVPPENIGSLFQPFHLLHFSNARKGLGLSIVQRLVEMQGGICGYEPSSEGGAKFFFTLPAEQDIPFASGPPGHA